MLEVSDLVVRFGGLAAVNGVSFSVPPKAIVGLIGPNGAGKTTAVNTISGFQRPNQGGIRLNGKPITGLRPDQVAARGLARTFQQTRTFGRVSVRESVLIAQHLRVPKSIAGALLGSPSVRAAEREAVERMESLLARVGLTDRGGEAAATLSYGEQRLLSIAIALATDPKLILLDEPTAGMNQREKGSVVELLASLRAEGLSILLVEHDMRLIMGTCDGIVVLHHGRKIAEGEPATIRNDPTVIDAYLGGTFQRSE